MCTTKSKFQTPRTLLPPKPEQQDAELVPSTGLPAGKQGVPGAGAGTGSPPPKSAGWRLLIMP